MVGETKIEKEKRNQNTYAPSQITSLLLIA